MKIGMISTIMTPENSALKAALGAQGAQVEQISDEHEYFLLEEPSGAHEGLDCLLCRSSSLSRSLSLTYAFEASGVPTLNSHSSQLLCGDKVLSSAALSKAGIPTPKVLLAFSAHSALAAADAMGYPCVIKPPIGSWGRMVCKVTDRHSADAVVSLKSHLGGAGDKIFYVQEYVDKPGRDVRVLLVGGEVALCVARQASNGSFLTNLNSGGRAEGFKLTQEMEEAVFKTGEVFGQGIYGIDLIEDGKGGFFVLEVNHAPEFSKSAGEKINEVAGKMASFAIKRARN